MIGARHRRHAIGAIGPTSGRCDTVRYTPFHVLAASRYLRFSPQAQRVFSGGRQWDCHVLAQRRTRRRARSSRASASVTPARGRPARVCGHGGA